MVAKAAPDVFTLGLVQMRCLSDPAANLERAAAKIREAAARGAEIVCLPELFRSLYFCQTEDHANFDLAEPIPGPSTKVLSAVARDAQVTIIASLFERRAAGLYHNTAVTIDADGAIVGTYRKMHIPDDPLYYEKFYFTPGDLGFTAVDTRVGRVGTLVCWDQWYPEGARLTSLAGADVLFYPTAIGWHPSEKAEFGAAQADAWRTIQRSHAIANGVYVAAANRVGYEAPPPGKHPGPRDAPRDASRDASDGGIEFWGRSFVCDPFGVVLAEASSTDEEILIVACDRRHQETVRRHWPFLRDRRIDAYGAITRRFSDE
jgi:N-carbamoylputrescine amidase